MEAVLFDLNGTLVDSERAHWMGYQEVFRELGFDFPYAEFCEDWTRHGRGLEHTLRRHDRSDLVPAMKEIKSKKDRIFRATMTARVVPMPGAKECLHELASHFKIGVDSTSARKDVEGLLAAYDLIHYFSGISSGDMTGTSADYDLTTKGGRFGFLAKKLGVEPTACVIVGDAEKDIDAAHEAGCSVVVVLNGQEEIVEFSRADRVVKDLTEVTPDLIRALESQ
jgi:beta-phosphoglucomutase-like phosphatase (HAD superfamily)